MDLNLDTLLLMKGSVTLCTLSRLLIGADLAIYCSPFFFLPSFFFPKSCRTTALALGHCFDSMIMTHMELLLYVHQSVSKQEAEE